MLRAFFWHVSCTRLGRNKMVKIWKTPALIDVSQCFMHQVKDHSFFWHTGMRLSCKKIGIFFVIEMLENVLSQTESFWQELFWHVNSMWRYESWSKLEESSFISKIDTVTPTLEDSQSFFLTKSFKLSPRGFNLHYYAKEVKNCQGQLSICNFFFFEQTLNVHFLNTT